MQKGSLIRSSRRRGPDVWEYRWRESCSGQRKKHRRLVIGTLDTLRDESAALKSIAALQRDININDRRSRTKPLGVAER
jgi:integrase